MGSAGAESKNPPPLSVEDGGDATFGIDGGDFGPVSESKAETFDCLGAAVDEVPEGKLRPLNASVRPPKASCFGGLV